MHFEITLETLPCYIKYAEEEMHASLKIVVIFDTSYDHHNFLIQTELNEQQIIFLWK
jgi:hypothetical protein